MTSVPAARAGSLDAFLLSDQILDVLDDPHVPSGRVRVAVEGDRVQQPGVLGECRAQVLDVRPAVAVGAQQVVKLMHPVEVAAAEVGDLLGATTVVGTRLVVAPQ